MSVSRFDSERPLIPPRENERQASVRIQAHAAGHSAHRRFHLSAAELLVRARRAEQLLVGAALDDDPALDDADAVGVPDGRETMGDDT